MKHRSLALFTALTLFATLLVVATPPTPAAAMPGWGLLTFGAQGPCGEDFISESGNPSKARCSFADVTPDGRYVLFTSDDSGTWPDDANGNTLDAFVLDRLTSELRLVSTDSSGVQSQDHMWGMAISDDGRYVAMRGYPRNLDPELPNKSNNLYLKDLQTGAFTRVTNMPDGGPRVTYGPYAENIWFADITPAGEVVYVPDWAGTLPGYPERHTFVYDIATGTTTSLMDAVGGGPPNGGIYTDAVSADGRYFLITSYATDTALPSDGGDIFRYDRVDGSVDYVNLLENGSPSGTGNPIARAMSPDGSRVVLQVYDNRVAADTNGDRDLYLISVDDRELRLVTTNGFSAVGFGGGLTGVTTNGRHVGFSAQDIALPGSQRYRFQAYLYDSVIGHVSHISGTSTDDVYVGHVTSNEVFVDGKDSTITFGTNVYVKSLANWAQGFTPVGVDPDLLFGGAYPAGTAGDPVNTATGALVETATDLTIPLPGRDLELRRNYNSNDSRSGVLGVGWRASFEMSATVGTDGTITVIDSDGRVQPHVPDGAGSYTPPATSTLNVDYDGTLVTAGDASGRTLTFDASGRPQSLVDPDGTDLTYSYDAQGRLASVAGNGRSITLAYNADGRLASATADDGRQVTYGYDASGRLESATSPAGYTITYGYDAANRLESITEPDGTRRHLTVYDASGRVVSQTDAAGGVTTFAYDVDSDWTGTVTMTDPGGNDWVDVYDRHVLIERYDPTGVAAKMIYDERLQLVATVEGAESVEYRYDDEGRITERIGTGGAKEQYTYDAEGRIATVVDATGALTTLEYDVNGRPASVTSGQLTTTYAYNAFGQPVSATFPDGGTFQWTYDADGNVSSVQTPSGVTTSWSYDPAGRRVLTTRPDGTTVGRTFDQDGRVMTADGGQVSLTYAYDAAGRPVSRTTHDGRAETFAYDSAGRRETYTRTDGVELMRYTYGPTGLVDTMTDALGRTAAFGYDAAGRLTSVSSATGTLAFSYDSYGRLASRTTRAGGTVTG